MTDQAAFGRRLRHARKDRGLSQRDLCHGICSNATLSRWESGQSQPTVQQIEVLAKRLGIAPEVLSGNRFESRLAMSETALPSLLHAVLSKNPLVEDHETVANEPVVGWVELLRASIHAANPWAMGNPDYAEALPAHPVSLMSTETLQAAVLVQAQAGLCREVNHGSLSALAQALPSTTAAPESLRTRALEALAFCTGAYLGPVAARKVLAAHPQTPWTPAVQVLAKRLGLPTRIPAEPQDIRDAIFRALARGASGTSAMEMALNTDVLSADWVPVFKKVPQPLRRAHSDARPAVPAPPPHADW